MTHVTVYGRSSCQPCRLTRRKLEDAGVPFVYVDLDSDPEALEGLTDLDWVTALPVVVAPGSRWCGLDLDRLRAVASACGRP